MVDDQLHKVTSCCLDMVQSAASSPLATTLSQPISWLPKADALGVSEFCYWPMGNTTQAGDKPQSLLGGAQKLIEFKPTCSNERGHERLAS